VSRLQNKKAARNTKKVCEQLCLYQPD